jgi:signal peptidase I
VIWFGGVLLVAAAIVPWVLRRRFLVVTVHGTSMAPTYRQGDRVLARRVPGHRVSAGQVVVADLPPVAPDMAGQPPEPASASRVVKRVAAVAGDRTPAGVDGAAVDGVVPAGKLVLLGDNPSASSDSRDYGYVSTDTVIGIVLRHLR